jgi:hypothetical protein
LEDYAGLADAVQPKPASVFPLCDLSFGRFRRSIRPGGLRWLWFWKLTNITHSLVKKLDDGVNLRDVDEEVVLPATDDLGQLDIPPVTVESATQLIGFLAIFVRPQSYFRDTNLLVGGGRHRLLGL